MVVGFASIYLAALLLAAASGFAAGRWHSHPSDLAGVRNQLAVEDLAWAEADVDLYVSTLDDALAGAAGEPLRAAFVRSAPWRVRHRITAATFPAPNRAVVMVAADSDGHESGREPGSPPVERRWYRLVGGSWLRTRSP